MYANGSQVEKAMPCPLPSSASAGHVTSPFRSSRHFQVFFSVQCEPTYAFYTGVEEAKSPIYSEFTKATKVYVEIQANVLYAETPLGLLPTRACHSVACPSCMEDILLSRSTPPSSSSPAPSFSPYPSLALACLSHWQSERPSR